MKHQTEGSPLPTIQTSHQQNEHVLPIVLCQSHVLEDPRRPSPDEDWDCLQQLILHLEHNCEVRTAPSSIPWVPILCVLSTDQPNPHIFEAHANYVSCLLCTCINSLYKEGCAVRFYPFVTQIACSWAPRDPTITFTIDCVVVKLVTGEFYWVCAEAHDLLLGSEYPRCWRNIQTMFPVWDDICTGLLFQPMYNRCHDTFRKIGWAPGLCSVNWPSTKVNVRGASYNNTPLEIIYENPGRWSGFNGS